MSPAAHPPSGQDKAPAGPAATTEHQCPEGGEPAATGTGAAPDFPPARPRPARDRETA
jgi:hypothetical protein